MKAKGSSIKRRVITMSALVSTLLMSGTITAFAHRLDDDSITRPASPVSAGAAGGTSAWIVALIVGLGIVALSAALIGTVRYSRTRGHTVAAGV